MGAFLGTNLTLNMGGGFLGETLTHNMGAFLGEIFNAKHGGLFRYKFNT